MRLLNEAEHEKIVRMALVLAGGIFKAAEEYHKLGSNRDTLLAELWAEHTRCIVRLAIDVEMRRSLGKDPLPDVAIDIAPNVDGLVDTLESRDKGLSFSWDDLYAAFADKPAHDGHVYDYEVCEGCTNKWCCALYAEGRKDEPDISVWKDAFEKD